jgi:HD superfamily phosphodiesterase
VPNLCNPLIIATRRHPLMTNAFAPFQDIATLLLPHTVAEKVDGSHDASHLLRVWNNVCAIRDHEGGDPEILIAATLLHDCVSVEKTRRSGPAPQGWLPPKPLNYSRRWPGPKNASAR